MIVILGYTNKFLEKHGFQHVFSLRVSNSQCWTFIIIFEDYSKGYEYEFFLIIFFPQKDMHLDYFKKEIIKKGLWIHGDFSCIVDCMCVGS